MGHLDQPLNTFWQTMVRPQGSSAWSNDVSATAVATNGGLVIGASDQSVIAGVVPSNLLTFSPLIATSTAGKNWTNGLIDAPLAKQPSAIAIAPTGQVLAVVDPIDREGGSGRVVESPGGLSGWQTLTSPAALQEQPSVGPCHPAQLTAVAYVGVQPVVGVSCASTGQVGIVFDRSGEWRLAGPRLPAPFDDGHSSVLDLHGTASQLTSLIEATGPGGARLFAVSTDDGGERWSVSTALTLKSSDTIASLGPAGADGLFVLISRPSGDETLDVSGRAGAAWTEMPAPPPGTATVTFGPSGDVEALAVHGEVLTAWALASSPGRWVRSQEVSVPIQYGSSG
jgi:hypothetical protein